VLAFDCTRVRQADTEAELRRSVAMLIIISIAFPLTRGACTPGFDM
jgi:hypothetical protein